MKITKKTIFSFIFLIMVAAIFNRPLIQPARAYDSLWQSQIGSSDLTAVYGGENAAKQDVRSIVVKIVNVVLSLLALVFLVLLVMAGFKYMMSGGNQDKTKEAVSQIKNAIIGLVIVMASWMIARYIIVITDQILKNKVDYTNYQVY